MTIHRIRLMAPWLVAVGLLCLVACSDGNGSDAGVDAGEPAADGVDGGDPGEPDCPLPEGFCLLFEPGARACGVFRDTGRTWEEEYAILGAVDFNPGLVELPVDLQEFEMDLIRRLLHGPDQHELSSLGPGMVTYSFRDDGGQDGEHRYVYTELFDFEGETYTFTLPISFYQQGGVPLFRAIRINADFTPLIYNGANGYTGDGSDHIRRQQFESCTYPNFPLWRIQAEAENGDTITIHKRLQFVLGGSGKCNIVWAELSADGTPRQVDDYFSLIYSGFHHNWNQSYVVLLDPPIGDVHGLLLQDNGISAPPARLVYLGSDLTELRASPLSSYSEQEQ